MGTRTSVKKEYEINENVKKFEVLDCPTQKYKICILSKLKKIKVTSGLIKSLKSATDNELSSCSKYPEKLTQKYMQKSKLVLP